MQPVQKEQSQKAGHETTREQPVGAASGEIRYPAAKTPAHPAKRVGGATGGPTLPAAQGSVKAHVPQGFPGQTVTTNAPSVSPEPPAPTTPSREEAEWQEASNTTDPAVVAKYWNDFPDGHHTVEAHRRYGELDEKAWKALDQTNNNDLQRYEHDFLYGGYLKDAALLMDHNDWTRVDKGNLQKVQEFIDRHQTSSHLPDAQSILNKLKTELSEAQAIQTALLQFNEAFKERKPDAVKQAWHRVPNRYLNAMRIPGVFIMALYPAGKAVVNGNVASIDCRLTMTTGSQQKPTERRETVTLAKEGDHWAIVDIPGLT
jgi:hypothetical protein